MDIGCIQLAVTDQSISLTSLNLECLIEDTSWRNIIWGIWALKKSAAALQLTEISCLQAGK